MRGCRGDKLRCVALGATKEPAGGSARQGCGASGAASPSLPVFKRLAMWIFIQALLMFNCWHLIF